MVAQRLDCHGVPRSYLIGERLIPHDANSRMFKKAAQRGRSERRGESHSLPYGEPLSDARTMLEVFFNILLMEEQPEPE